MARTLHSGGIGPIAEPKKGSFVMGEHLSPDKRGEILRILKGTVRFLKANEAQKRAVRMKMESKVRSLLEIKHMTRQKFQEELEGDFRRIFDTNYGLSKQIKTFLERHWTQ